MRACVALHQRRTPQTLPLRRCIRLGIAGSTTPTLRLLCDATPSARVVDTYANQAWLQLFQRTRVPAPSEMSSPLASPFLHPADTSQHEHQLREMFRSRVTAGCITARFLTARARDFTALESFQVEYEPVAGGVRAMMVSLTDVVFMPTTHVQDGALALPQARPELSTGVARSMLGGITLPAEAMAKHLVHHAHATGVSPMSATGALPRAALSQDATAPAWAPAKVLPDFDFEMDTLLGNELTVKRAVMATNDKRTAFVQPPRLAPIDMFQDAFTFDSFDLFSLKPYPMLDLARADGTPLAGEQPCASRDLPRTHSLSDVFELGATVGGSATPVTSSSPVFGDALTWDAV